MAQSRSNNRARSGRGSGSQQPRTTGGHKYTQGALAMDMSYAPEQQPRPRRGNPKKRPKKIVFVMSAKTRNLALSSYVVVGVIFVCVLAMLAAGANVTLQRQENAHAANQLRQLDVQNTRLQNQITQARNVDEIKYIARTRLNMDDPPTHNIHAVTLVPMVEVPAVFSAPIDINIEDTSQWVVWFENMRDFLLNDS